MVQTCLRHFGFTDDPPGAALHRATIETPLEQLRALPAKELAELAEAAGVPRADVSAAMKYKNQGKVLTAIVEQRKRKKKELLVEPLPERGEAGGGGGGGGGGGE
jgi:hypothetical protein